MLGPLPALELPTSLQHVNLEWNNFTGNLPTPWATLPLESIKLSHNRLDGADLPTAWASMHTLHHCDLSFNNFTATLPPSWSALAQLTHLYALNTIRLVVHKEWCNTSAELWEQTFENYSCPQGL